jgi:hypothetical protein
VLLVLLTWRARTERRHPRVADPATLGGRSAATGLRPLGFDRCSTGQPAAPSDLAAVLPWEVAAAARELAHTFSAVRDSKNPAGPTIRGDVRELLVAVRGDLVRG